MVLDLPEGTPVGNAEAYVNSAGYARETVNITAAAGQAVLSFIPPRSVVTVIPVD